MATPIRPNLASPQPELLLEPGAMQSPEIGKLAEALSKAQAEIKAPKKGREAEIKSDKGAYKYSYADLADVIECYREPLSKHGLALLQPMRIEDGHLVLVTKLVHLSGQWVASEYPITNYNRPQEQGSAITYARRYAATSMLGIAAQDDDDGQAAQRAADPPPSGDVGRILELADEIQQSEGGTVDEIIRQASYFIGDDSKAKSFTDPTKVRSAKWLKGTRERLESQLHKIQARNEPGADEGAALLK